MKYKLLIQGSLIPKCGCSVLTRNKYVSISAKFHLNQATGKSITITIDINVVTRLNFMNAYYIKCISTHCHHSYVGKNARN